MLGYEQIRRALLELDCRYQLDGVSFISCQMNYDDS